MTIEEKIKQALGEALKKMGVAFETSNIVIERSKSKEHGDFATNLALRLGGVLHKKPQDIADDIIKNFSLKEVSKVEKAGPGFINFFIDTSSLDSLVAKIISEGDNYGQSDYGKKEKTLLEYVSANPTGALHLGHARGAAIGDSLARILKKCGYDVTREYYVNDAGNQVNNLGRSLKARYLQANGIQADVPEDGYHGPDIIAFGEALKAEGGDSYKTKPLSFFVERGVSMALENIKKDLKEFRVEFDVFTSEKAIRGEGKVEAVIKLLE
jgi:arginyl-tRNA synthetase